MEPEITLGELETRIDDLSLDLDSESMREYGYRVIDWLIERLEGMRGETLGNELNREQTEELLREGIPEQGGGFERVFDEYASKVAPNSIALDHPRFFAFIPSAPTFIGILADTLAAGTNVFAGTWLESSGPSQVELVVIDWFKEMLGLPAEASGLLVSGGSVATLTALAAARRAVLDENTQRATVYFSDQTHASVHRALRILGMKTEQMHSLSTDAEYRLNTAELARCIRRDRELGLQPFLVIANAGTTNSGAIDPLTEIAEIAAENAMWFHADAAYGGFAALTERGRKLLKGIERADSVVLDPHKWLYCPFEAGCAIVRDGRLLRQTFRLLPEYLDDVVREDREVNFCDYGLQLTRSFRALKVWMTIKTYGAGRLRKVINQCLDLAEYATRLFQDSPHLEIVTRPQLGVFTFRYVPGALRKDGARGECSAGDLQRLNRLNEALVARIIASRKLMLSSTWLGARRVLRFCVLNHRTRKENVREALRLIEQFGREVESDAAW